jgi:hypothetical protein
VALRTLPFVSFLVSSPLVYLFVVTMIGDSTVAVLSMACFAMAHGAVDYATEVKQYMVDHPLRCYSLCSRSAWTSNGFARRPCSPSPDRSQ